MEFIILLKPLEVHYYRNPCEFILQSWARFFLPLGFRHKSSPGSLFHTLTCFPCNFKFAEILAVSTSPLSQNFFIKQSQSFMLCFGSIAQLDLA
jgi:hypothetical protein